MTHLDFAHRVRSGAPVVGYWVVTDNPVGTERLARVGYDYVAVDMQHGLVGFQGLVHSMMAIDAGGSSGIVRVEANSPTPIGRALDAGAVGVIVPLIDSAADAERAVAATRYPPHGVRSYGPMRSGLRIGPTPDEANRTVLCFAMIETAEGLANVDEIAAVPGLDGIYIGPSDLTIALGGTTSTDESMAGALADARRRVLAAADANGIVPGIHSPSGYVAQERLSEGFRFVSVASDVVHLEQIAAAHLNEAKGNR